LAIAEGLFPSVQDCTLYLVISIYRIVRVRRGVAGYVGAGRMAWEATAENCRRRRAAALGFGVLLLVRFAAGNANCPLTEKKYTIQFTCKISGGRTAVYSI